jgi:hypothetical protein
MKSMLLYALLSLGASPQAPLADGTLLFLENCNSVVQWTTQSEIGHVALAFTDGGQPYIYEATPAQVRRVTADEYYAELARLNLRRDEDERIRVWALKPARPYSAKEIVRMREYLDGQVGRRYSVRNYVLKKPADGTHSVELGRVQVKVAVDLKDPPSEGIHCAELASTTLNQSGRYGFDDCHRIDPQGLYAAMKPASAAPLEIAVPAPAAEETWCVRAQRRWGQWRTWCGWSCQEAWSWCW